MAKAWNYSRHIRDNLSRIKLLRRKNRSNPPQIRRIRSIFGKKILKKNRRGNLRKISGKRIFWGLFQNTQVRPLFKKKKPSSPSPIQFPFFQNLKKVPFYSTNSTGPRDSSLLPSQLSLRLSPRLGFFWILQKAVFFFYLVCLFFVKCLWQFQGISDHKKTRII